MIPGVNILGGLGVCVCFEPLSRKFRGWSHLRKVLDSIKEHLAMYLCILLEIQQSALGPRKSASGVTYLSLRINPKSCCIFPLKVVATLLSGSRKSTVGALRLHANTSSLDVCWRKSPNWHNHLELCHRNSDILERVLNLVALSN